MTTIEKLKLGEDINEHFVKGLMIGYQRYLQVRAEAANELVISNGYAYTRGNHLEDKIAKETLSNKVSFGHAKAGSWSYLRFKIADSTRKNMIIVRRFERIEEIQNDLKEKSVKQKETNWLYPLAKINDNLDLKRFINDGKDKQLKLFAANTTDENAIIKQEQLELQFEQEFDGFYILTYEINKETNRIEDASLLMLDSETLELIEVESLQQLVVKYQAIITDELLESVQENLGNEEYSGLATDFVVSPTEEISGEDTDFLFSEG